MPISPERDVTDEVADLFEGRRPDWLGARSIPIPSGATVKKVLCRSCKQAVPLALPYRTTGDEERDRTAVDYFELQASVGCPGVGAQHESV